MLPDPAEQRACDARVTRPAETILDVFLHTLILLEISLDEIGCFLGTDSKLLRKPERRLPVNDSEVDGFGPFSLFRSDALYRQAQYGSGCASVDVFAGCKGLGQSRIPGKMSQDAQLHLWIGG